MQDAISTNNLDTQMGTGHARPLSLADAIEQAREALATAAKLEAKPMSTRANVLRLKSLLADVANLMEYAEGLL